MKNRFWNLEKSLKSHKKEWLQSERKTFIEKKQRYNEKKELRE